MFFEATCKASSSLISDLLSPDLALISSELLI